MNLDMPVLQIYMTIHTHMQRYNGSSMLLDNIETYGVYLSESLTSPVVDTSQYVNGINLAELNIGEFTVITLCVAI